MLKTLLCKLHLGHHWLAAADPDGSLAPALHEMRKV